MTDAAGTHRITHISELQGLRTMTDLDYRGGGPVADHGHQTQTLQDLITLRRLPDTQALLRQIPVQPATHDVNRLLIVSE